MQVQYLCVSSSVQCKSSSYVCPPAVTLIAVVLCFYAVSALHPFEAMPRSPVHSLTNAFQLVEVYAPLTASSWVGADCDYVPRRHHSD
jgi:hypothetical protein